MADISMCNNSQCPKAQTCYRHRAIPNEHWQTYANFTPEGEEGCGYYWPIEDRTNLRPFEKEQS